MKWVKNLLQREPFMPLSREFILSINLLKGLCIY